MHANAADLSPENIGRESDALTVPLEVFDRTLTVNLRGHLLCTRHALEPIIERGGGAIVSASTAGPACAPENRLAPLRTGLRL